MGQDPYRLFKEIDGSHSFKTAVPDGFVDYQVRRRAGGKIAYFNFDLAKEMGLIPADHPHRLNAALSERLLETFGIVVINEWDIANNRKFPKEDYKPNRYMATRYLQLQHPGKLGKTSGDGRGIWNGEIKSRGLTWDISSSGTGATCLSPAVAHEKKFFKTGDPEVCYGNGYNTPIDGFSTALMSEIFHANGIPTERTLVIVEFAGDSSVNVRAAKNLLRPSHLFHHLKQGNFSALKSAVDYFIERQVANGEWHFNPSRQSPYDFFAEQMALSFSKLAAQFESEYVFCWLDWDGDNILANAGIIDYGSVRQFGLFHDEYRYDDVDRFSTKLSEQKIKARYLMQTCAQIRDFLLKGRKRNIKKFKNDPLLKLFDQSFEYWMDEFLLKKVGFETRQRNLLMKDRKTVSEFRKVFAYFERAQSSKGIRSVADGVTSDAIFCMGDCLKSLPKQYLKNKSFWLEPEKFIKTMKSSYAKRRDLKITSYRLTKIREFQDRYMGLIEQVGKKFNQSADEVLTRLAERSAQINRHDRITGDGVMEATEIILGLRKRWSQSEIQALIEDFIHTQILDPARQIARRKTSSGSSGTSSREARIQLAVEKVRKQVLELWDGL